MVNDDDHISKLVAARSRMVAERRVLVIELTGEYKRGHAEHLREQLLKIQATIEAVDRAIDDEKHMASKQIRTDTAAGDDYMNIPTAGGVRIPEPSKQ